MEQLKAKERLVYDYICTTINEKGYPPTVRDICAALGIRSTSSVHIYLERLEHKGYLKRESGKSRSMTLDIEGEQSKYRVPVLGQVAAGIPILAQQTYEGYTTFSSSKSFDPSTLFALRVKGESMINAGILHGDLIIVQNGRSCDNGDIVVAMVDDEATVKRFYKENGKYRLQPENDTMQPIIVNSVEIVGKVVGLIRHY